MLIHCRCQSCDKKFKVDAKLAGRKLRCSKCDGEVSVPPMATSLDDKDDESGSLLDISGISTQSTKPRPGSSAKLTSPAAGGSSKQAASRPGPKSRTPMILAAVLGVIVVGAGIPLLLSSIREPVLLLEWPVEERSDASLTIDRQEIPLTTEMPMRVPVSPGKHRVLIRRRGYEPHEWNINIGRGDQQPLTPEWKALPTLDFE